MSASRKNKPRPEVKKRVQAAFPHAYKGPGGTSRYRLFSDAESHRICQWIDIELRRHAKSLAWAQRMDELAPDLSLAKSRQYHSICLAFGRHLKMRVYECISAGILFEYLAESGQIDQDPPPPPAEG